MTLRFPYENQKIRSTRNLLDRRSDTEEDGFGVGNGGREVVVGVVSSPGFRTFVVDRLTDSRGDPTRVV